MSFGFGVAVERRVDLSLTVAPADLGLAGMRIFASGLAFLGGAASTASCSVFSTFLPFRGFLEPVVGFVAAGLLVRSFGVACPLPRVTMRTRLGD